MSIPERQLTMSADVPVPCWFSTAATHIGHVRAINEDAFLDGREQGLWAVADGMGGHSQGDRASQEIIAQLSRFTASRDAESNLQSLMGLLEAANRTCREQHDDQVMGSTVAALHVVRSRGFLLWAGDSRIYRLRDGTLRQLTDDHSLVQELFRLGELTAEQAENHPSSNVITRAIGVNDELEVQVRETEIRSGDRFLLCTDGLFKDLGPDEFESLIALPSAQHARDEMLSLALSRGGRDNITLVVVHVGQV